MGKNIALTIVTLLVCLLLCEGAFRLYEDVVLSDSYNPKGPAIDLAELNYNDSKVAKKKPAGQFRILSFGDSYAYAVVRYPYTYHGVAAKILDTTFPGKTFRLVNFGEPSTSFYQYLQAINTWTGIVQYDAVLVNVFLGNDIAEVGLNIIPDNLPLNQVSRDRAINLQTGRKRRNAVPHAFGLRMFDYVYAYIQMYFQGDYAKKTVPEPYTFALGRLPEDVYYKNAHQHLLPGEPSQCGTLARGWQGLADVAKRLDRLARERGVKVAIMLSPAEAMVYDTVRRATANRYHMDADRIEPDLPDRMARRIVAMVAPDVPVLDLLPIFRCAAAQGKREYNPSETHWDVDGNKLAGQALARFLARVWFHGDVPGLAKDEPCLTATAQTPLINAPDPTANACLSAVTARYPLKEAAREREGQ